MSLFTRINLGLQTRAARFQLRKQGIDTLLSLAPPVARPPAHLELWWLYRDIVRLRPRRIVELGCGYSTLVILSAISSYVSDQPAQLLSIDANRDWLDAWTAKIPVALAQFWTAEYCELERISHNGDAAHRYRRQLTPDLDFLFLDGPSPRDVPGWSGQPIAAEPVLWQQAGWSKPARIVVEGREANVAFLQKHLTGFSRKEHPPLRWTTFDRRCPQG